MNFKNSIVRLAITGFFASGTLYIILSKYNNGLISICKFSISFELLNIFFIAFTIEMIAGSDSSMSTSSSSICWNSQSVILAFMAKSYLAKLIIAASARLIFSSMLLSTELIGM